MKNWKLYAIGLGCLAFLVIACVAHDALILAYMAHDPHDRQEKIQTTLEWGRLAPFPDEISNFEIQTEGSIFTRASDPVSSVRRTFWTNGFRSRRG